MVNSELNQDEILEANRVVHSNLAISGEYEKSPHFLPENKQRVLQILTELRGSLSYGGETRLLDMGCGTGFILHLASPIFDKLHGIDITNEMMEKVDLSLGNIEISNCLAESTPFEDSSFDMVTAYSFLDHLADYTKVFEEAHRVLRPSGIFYSDLNPNRGFNSMLENLSVNHHSDLPEVINREIRGGLSNGEYYSEKFGIDEKMLTKAEPVKSYSRGFDTDEVINVAKSIGFSDIKVEYFWYLGQSYLSRQSKYDEINAVEDFLQMLLPASGEYYKYLRFIFRK